MKIKKVLILMLICSIIFSFLPQTQTTNAAVPLVAYPIGKAIGWIGSIAAGAYIWSADDVGAQLGEDVAGLLAGQDEVIYQLGPKVQQQLEVTPSVIIPLPPATTENEIDFVKEAERIIAEYQLNSGGNNQPEPSPPPGVRGQPMAIALDNLRDIIERVAPFVEKHVNQSKEKWEEGYVWCFLTQSYVPIETTQPAAPHPLLLGYCSITGLPIIQSELLGGQNIVLDEKMLAAFRQHVSHMSFIDIQGRVHSVSIDGFRVRTFINGENIITWSHFDDFKVLGFAFVNNDLGRPRIVVDTGTRITVNPVATMFQFGESIPPKAPPLVLPIPPKFKELNAIDNLDGVMARLMEVARELQGTNDQIYINVPMLFPEDYPGLTAEEFDAFQTLILNLYNGLPDLLMTPEQIAATPPELIINLDLLFEKPEPETGTVAGIIQAILNTVRAIPDLLRQIWQAIINIGGQISNAFNAPDDDPFIPPDMDEDVEVDLYIDLMDYFPFCLPRDFVDIVRILLGDMPPELAGATQHERAAFNYYTERGYVTPEGQAFLEPLFPNGFEFDEDENVVTMSSWNAPVFEFVIPFPRFNNHDFYAHGFGLNVLAMDEIHVGTIDFADYPVLVAIIRLGVLVIFLVSMINASAKLITW